MTLQTFLNKLSTYLPVSDEAPLLVCSLGNVSASDAIDGAAIITASLSSYEALSVVAGTVVADGMCWAAGIFPTVCYSVSTGATTFSGKSVASDMTLDPSYTRLEESTLTAAGIQYLYLGLDNLLHLAHDYTSHVDEHQAEDPTQHCYALCTRSRIIHNLQAILETYRGKTQDQLPDLVPIVEQVLSSCPAVRLATYTITIDAPAATITVVIQATLYGELSFQVTLLA